MTISAHLFSTDFTINLAISLSTARYFFATPMNFLLLLYN